MFMLLIVPRYENEGRAPPALEDFVLSNDAHLYDPEVGLSWMIDRAEVRLINQTSSLTSLYDALENLNLANEQRLRPNWDQYFMELASLAAKRSNCMKRRVGSVLVRERRVISTGYNGTPRNLKNCNEGGCKCQSSTVGLVLTICKVQGAILEHLLAYLYRPASAYMQRRMLCLKPVESELEKARFFIATRK